MPWLLREKAARCYPPGSQGDWHGQQPSRQPLPPPSPFPPHPLAVSLPLAKEACEQRQEAVHVWPRLTRQARRTSAHTRLRSPSHTRRTRAHTPVRALSVSETSAGPIQQQCELPDSLLSISRHAAEKEEFHFWSLRRVRIYICHDFQSSLTASHGALLPVRLRFS